MRRSFSLKFRGVPPGASVKEVKKAYRQRAKKEHPDVNKSPGALERWRRLSDAYGKLIDPAYRKQWEDSQRAPRERVRPDFQASSQDVPPEVKMPNMPNVKMPNVKMPKVSARWAAAGWDAFKELLRDDRTAASPALREARAAELELEKMRSKLTRLKADEERFRDLTERFKRNGQKMEELEAGKRTGGASRIQEIHWT